MIKLTTIGIFLILIAMANAKEYHVAKNGSDANIGSVSTPFKTISAAAQVAQPGDTIIVHQGTYRERINPPRGGISDTKRIVYQAAPGEKVFIKGSETVKDWQQVGNDTWKVSLPNSLFGDFNPYKDEIRGDWFNPWGRKHHTGAVYLNGHWLTEAAKLEHVLQPVGHVASFYDPRFNDALLNVAWFKPASKVKKTKKISAANFSDKQGVGKTSCSEGGQCIGWINNNEWVRYEDVDFGEGSEEIEFRAASDSRGGIIEIRLDSPDGELLGICSVSNTGGWQSWATFKTKIKSVSGIQKICLLFKAKQMEDAVDVRLWYAKVESQNTTIWAQFKDINPNENLVEINVRQTVFYPEKPGINYITVSGFLMMHAATPWAPPTAEQIGLIGVHWSKGWIIEKNDISHSVCTGITLGKHGDQFDNSSENTAEGYVKTIERALKRGWSRDKVGSHVVRNNHISHCEQAGIVGSMGPVFCTITNNIIHDIHVRRLFTGAEMAGIKFHGAVDTEISHNHIYNTCRGIWLDWMTQGTRVTGNLLHDNGPSEDLFVEVNHGPFLVDNNIFLSANGFLVNSQGGAYVHNLIMGQVRVHVGELRLTPHLRAHSTEVADLAPNLSGDERYYNNIFVNGGLTAYDPVKLPVFMAGNVFLNGARPSKFESNALIFPEIDPDIKLLEQSDGTYLQINYDKVWLQHHCQLVTTESLGRAKTPDLLYVQPDKSPYNIKRDYFSRIRNITNPCVGPFECKKTGISKLKVW